FAQDFKRLARESVKIIVDQITTRNQSLVKLMVPTKLIQRKSTLKS
ncbi:TPA: LacI family transcriptional regulator, partial [Vibrio cholerae]|nr:LacI family transcriptional regulator [Vibrio cholerae]